MTPRFSLSITSVINSERPIPGIPQAPFMRDIGVVRILIYCSYFEIFEN